MAYSLSRALALCARQTPKRHRAPHTDQCQQENEFDGYRVRGSRTTKMKVCNSHCAAAGIDAALKNNWSTPNSIVPNTALCSIIYHMQIFANCQLAMRHTHTHKRTRIDYRRNALAHKYRPAARLAIDLHVFVCMFARLCTTTKENIAKNKNLALTPLQQNPISARRGTAPETMAYIW